MAINLNLLSINVKEVDTWFECAEMLKLLADKVDIFRQNFRGILNQRQRDKLRSFSQSLRDKSVDITTISAISFLETPDSELRQLKQAISQIDQLLNDIINTLSIISGLANILGLITNILAFPA